MTTLAMQMYGTRSPKLNHERKHPNMKTISTIHPPISVTALARLLTAAEKEHGPGLTARWSKDGKALTIEKEDPHIKYNLDVPCTLGALHGAVGSVQSRAHQRFGNDHETTVSIVAQDGGHKIAIAVTGNDTTSTSGVARNEVTRG